MLACICTGWEGEGAGEADGFEAGCTAAEVVTCTSPAVALVLCCYHIRCGQGLRNALRVYEGLHALTVPRTVLVKEWE